MDDDSSRSTAPGWAPMPVAGTHPGIGEPQALRGPVPAYLCGVAHNV